MTSFTARRNATSRNYRRAALTGIGAVALGVSVLAGTGSAGAQPQTAPHASGGAGRYVTATHLCDAPRRGEWSCFAMQLRTVSRTTPGARPMNTSALPATTGLARGFSPADLAKIYGYTPSNSTTQTVAVVDAFRNLHVLSDLNHFDAAYGLPKETATSFREVNQSGLSSPLPPGDFGWAGEIDLDVQAVRAVCNKCKIVLVEATNQSNADLAAAVNTAAKLHANEVTNSYGGPEDPAHPLPSSQSAAYNHPGVLITASTGDHGWYDWDYVNYGGQGAWSDNAPNTPSSLPSVLAVGGTTVSTNIDGTRNTETVWNSNADDDANGYDGTNWLGAQGASGGGCSTTYNAPSFQAQAAGFSDTGCGTRRMTGDVAADADPATGFDVYDTYVRSGSGGWTTFGGTSLSSPLVAAMWALAGGSGGAYYPPVTVYDHLANVSAKQPYDVTTGGNAMCGGDDPTSCLNYLQGLANPITNPNHYHNGNTDGPYGGYAGLVECGISRATSNETAATSQYNQCHAATGYDGPSGVGTPTGPSFFTSLLPHASVGLPATRVGLAGTYRAINFHDGFASYQPKDFTFEFGDGTAPQKATYPATSVSHTYRKAGTYLLTLVVSDDHNRVWFQNIAVKVGYPLTARITGPASAHRNAVVTYSGAGSTDPNSGDTIARYIWSVGSTVISQSQSFTYHWTTTGTHTLSLQVIDNAGQSARASLAVTVVP